VTGSDARLQEAAAWLRAGGIVVFPTETFYGLAVDPESADAVTALFDLKGRPDTHAVPLVAGTRDQVARHIGPLTGLNARLAEVWWPGPLSLLFNAPAAIAPAVHAGTGAVAVRVPDHPVARALAETFGRPVTATSANRSGEPPATEVSVIADLVADARVFVLAAGRTPGGRPSTIVDARFSPPVIVRDGAIPADRVLATC
jgi:L-threonylcarbamoyladenylate synthase